MESQNPARLRLHIALGKLEAAADSIAEAAFSMDQQELNEDNKLLRDYYARLSMSLHDSLQELRVLAAKRH